MRLVTARQLEILVFIKAFRKEHGVSPSTREIGAKFEISSLRGVTVHIDALERKGLITRVPGMPRGIVPVDDLPKSKGLFSIVSDGTGRGTRVLTPEGVDITNGITRIDIRITKDGASAVLTVPALVDVQVPVTDKVESNPCGS